MPNYLNGKVYAIRSPHTDLVYIGSTTQQLSKRFYEHKTDKKRGRNITSVKIIEFGDAYIELVESYPCTCVEELQRREGEIMRENNCVNRCIAGRTPKEWRDDNKEKLAEDKKKWADGNKERVSKNNKTWREDNIEYVKEQKKIHYEKNKKEILAKNKIWRDNNKEKIAIRKKEHRVKNRDTLNVKARENYQKNKERLSLKSKEKFTCECGSVLTKKGKPRHLKTKKHKRVMNLRAILRD